MIKVDEIRPLDVMVDQSAAMQHDVDWMNDRKAEFVRVACPACGGERATALYEKYGLDQVKCQDCSTQYITPRPTAKMLADFYGQSENYKYWAKYVFPASREVRQEKLFRPRAKKIGDVAKKILKESKNLTLLEVGAAHGMFCEEAKKTGVFAKVVGIEPTPDLAQVCRDLGIHVIEAPYEQVALDEKVDVIAHFEVIEHLFDPKAFMDWSYEQCCSGGLVFLTCPNIEGFETSILGKHSGAVDNEHMNLFTPSSLSLLMERCGFEVIEISTPGVLDVEIVQNAISDGLIKSSDIDPMLRAMMAPELGDQLQAFLTKNKLSSNMQIIARKR